MNFLAHCTPNENSVFEIPTGIKRGYSQLYRWECAALNFKFEAWVSYQGDYTLAKNEMEQRLREAQSVSSTERALEIRGKV